MLEERARVLRVGTDRVWVEANRQLGCAKCEAGEGCGGGMLSRLVRRRESCLEVQGDVRGLKPGDAIVVGFDEQALLKSSIMAYLFPVMGMFAGALLAEFLLDAHDLVVAAAGIAGLMAGFFAFSYFSEIKRKSRQYQPRVLRRLTGESQGCQVYLPEP